MYYVYILKSEKDGRTYVGYTRDLAIRIAQHNSGLSTATKHRRPFTLVAHEQCATMRETKARERYWKSGAGRRKMRLFFT